MKNKWLYFYVWSLLVSVSLLALFVLAAYLFMGLPLLIMVPALLFCLSGIALMISALGPIRKGIQKISTGDLSDNALLLLIAGCALASFGFLSLVFFPRTGIFIRSLLLLGFLFLLLKAITLSVELYKKVMK